ncbi:MAG: endo-1,4-beta-xylanase, partial [Phycisphaerae bacterium]|nr:endo-1,4-beta-xylanase [Phycisphaerae bacterium]
MEDNVKGKYPGFPLTILLAAFFSAAATTLARPSQSATEIRLRDLVQGRLLLGAAVEARHLDNPAYARTVATHFNCITAGNEMKPDALQREKGKFTFDRADRMVDFAHQHNMTVVGHTLLWHSQSPRWLFEDEAGRPLPREEALTNLREHITTVLRHFKGRVIGWDVVNEALSDAPEEYLRDTPARRAIGDDYVIQAFRIAREADPEVELYYNDYNIEADYKRAKALRLVGELREAGVRVDALGIQGHWLLRHPDLTELERGFAELSATGLRLMVTELDIDPLPRRRAGADVAATEVGLDPYPDGLPSEVDAELARRYGEVFGLMIRYANEGKLSRITLWGVDDGTSWLNYWPVR